MVSGQLDADRKKKAAAVQQSSMFFDPGKVFLKLSLLAGPYPSMASMASRSNLGQVNLASWSQRNEADLRP